MGKSLVSCFFLGHSVVVADASTTDDETVVVGDAAVAHKSTTDGDRVVTEGNESVIVNEMSDELTKVDGSAVGDLSDRDGVIGTVFSNNTISLDQI